MTTIRVSANPDLTPVKHERDVPTTSIELVVDSQLIDDGCAFVIARGPDGKIGVKKDANYRFVTRIIDE